MATSLRHAGWTLCLIAVCGCAGSGDPCASNNGGCDPHATCADNGGVAACTCEFGFAGDGKTCVDVDECAANIGVCSADAMCSNTIGSFTCACDPGYFGDGFTCTQDGGIIDAGRPDSGQPIDAGPDNECGTATCDLHATCTPVGTSEVCVCNAGWTGDGMACVAVVDAGPGDAGPLDAGLIDAGPVDAGPVDAGPVDAGPVDAGPIDAGPIDAGPVDAGQPSSLSSETVSGPLQFDPLELEWRGQDSSWTLPGPCANGQAADGTPYNPDGGLRSIPPCLAGDTVTMIDQVQQSEGLGPLGSGTTNWEGQYAAPSIDLVDTSIGLLGNVTDPSGLLAPSTSIVAFPPFSSHGTAASPIYVVSQAFMQHIAAVIQTATPTMTYASMMSQGVALIHIITSSGAPEPCAQLYGLYGLPLGAKQGFFSTNESLHEMPFSGMMTGAPYTYYIGPDVEGVYPYSDGAVSTGPDGLVVVVGPVPLFYQCFDSQCETAYTSEQGGEGPFIVFGGQPGAVVDVFLSNPVAINCLGG